MYDPAQKRFLSPDPHVTDPLFGQNYNRYSYVLNNPLRFTDPTGFSQAAGDLKGEGGATGADAATAEAPTPGTFTDMVYIDLIGEKVVAMS